MFKVYQKERFQDGTCTGNDRCFRCIKRRGFRTARVPGMTGVSGVSKGEVSGRHVYRE